MTHVCLMARMHAPYDAFVCLMARMHAPYDAYVCLMARMHRMTHTVIQHYMIFFFVTHCCLS